MRKPLYNTCAGWQPVTPMATACGSETNLEQANIDMQDTLTGIPLVVRFAALAKCGQMLQVDPPPEEWSRGYFFILGRRR